MTDEYIRKHDVLVALMDNDLDHIQAPNGKEAVQIFSELPPADVAPVVMCKYCRYRVDPDKCCHPDGMLRRKNDDFCSYGEREE